MDSPFDETQMKVGRRLAMKVLNASRFILSIEMPGGHAAGPASVTEPADLSMLASLRSVVTAATEAFNAFDYTSALEVSERFFWQFCDDCLELVKERAYGAQGAAGAASALAALRLALSVQLRLFAPFLPYVTEEVWSWWQTGSVHTSAWPVPAELPEAGDPILLDDVAAALVGVRGAKSQAKVSMKTEVLRAEFAAPPEVLDRLRTVEEDLRSVGRLVGEIVWVSSDYPLSVLVDLDGVADQENG